MSADVIFSSSWDFSSASSVGGQLNYTVVGPLTNRFNASAALLRNSVAGDSSLSIPSVWAMISCRAIDHIPSQAPATSVHLSMVMPLVRLVPLGTKAGILPILPWADGRVSQH